MDGMPAIDRAEAPVFEEAAVPRYYSRKTKDILHKYGPGPRVHFHLGLFGSEALPNTTVDQSVLKDRIVRAQEDALDHAAKLWGAAESSPGHLLDVGCGLGGGSLYWAQEHGYQVTALTNTEEHVAHIRHFARLAGMSGRVQPELSDIHEYHPSRTYEAAVAFESSGYMDRQRMFEVVGEAVRPGGWFGLQEHFVLRPEWSPFIDAYYKTRLGSIAEYVDAGRLAGFELEQNEDVTDLVAEFWVQSMAWTTAELDRMERAEIPGTERSEEAPILRSRLTESALTHGKFFRAWRDHAVETRMLLFRRVC